MRSLSSAAKERIASIVEDMFSNLAIQLVGNLPKYQKRKTLFIGQSKNSLATLFVQSMSNQRPSELERDLLKGLLDSASNYIDALQSRTKSNIAERLDALVRERNLRNQMVESYDIQTIIAEEMAKAKSHLIKIAEAESSKIRTMGTAINISKASADVGEKDPTIFFQVLKDGNTCKYCIQNHLEKDGITPKVFKLSQVRHGYLSSQDRKDGQVSLALQHPHCRCTLTYIPQGFGFKNGMVSYISQDHNEFDSRKK
jgi:hypothetical protein